MPEPPWTPAAHTAASLRMIPVDLERPAPETLEFVIRCARCGAAKDEMVRHYGQWVCRAC